MTALALDTHAFVKELRAAGFSEAQAEAVTSVVRRSQEAEIAGLATKADTLALEERISARLAKAESDIIKWVAGMIGFQTLAVLGAVVALSRSLHP